jgi:hypothetical protein
LRCLRSTLLSNALLDKNGDDWENYSRHHLGFDRSANGRTKARYKFLFAKANRLYRSGLIATIGRIERPCAGAIDLACRDQGMGIALAARLRSVIP